MNASDFLTGPLAQAIGWAVLHLVWQGALVAAILAAALALLERRSANVRYAVSCSALALLLVLAIATGWRAYDAPRPLNREAGMTRLAAIEDVAAPAATDAAEATVAASPSVLARAEALATSARAYLPQIVLAWLVGVVVLSLRLLISWLRAHRLATRTGLPAGEAWEEAVTVLARALGLRRAVRLLQSAAVEVPTVVGWIRPVILLPVSTLAGLSPQQVEMVLAHELAHIRRHDFFVNLLQAVVETLMFYHPAVWWMSRRVRIERENCCDDLAVAVCGNPVQYARALTRLEELRADVPHIAVAANGGSLLGRIKRLVTEQPADRTAIASRWAAGATVLTIVALLVAMPPLPALARADEEKPAATTVEVTPTAEAVADGVAEGVAEAVVEADADADDEDIDLAPIPAVTPVPPVPPVPAVAPVARVRPLPTPMPTPAVAPIPPVAPMALLAPMPGTPAPAPPAPPTPPAFDIAAMNFDWVGDHEEGGKSEERADGKLSVDDLIHLRVAGVTPQYIDEMRKLDLGTLTMRDISSMRLQNVTPQYIRDLRAAGMAIKTARDAVSLKVQNVTPAYIRELNTAGFKTLSVRDVVSLKALNVTPEFIRQLAAAGYSNLSIRDLTRLAAAGVNGDFIREMEKYRTK